MNFRRGKFVCTALLVVTFAGLGARVLWHAATTETGWQFLEEQARWATLGWFIEPEPIVQRLPPEQAEFWLERNEEVLARHPDDAEVAMGAALMLDHPDRRYRWTLYTVHNLPVDGVHVDGVHRDQVEQMEQQFDSLCRERSLELAELATHLEPDNLAWWRLRALLLSPRFYQRDYFESRTPDWEEILQTCAEHDPDNALYDYLAAQIHFHASGEIALGDDGNMLLETQDADRLAAGIASFERAQAKPLLVIGREGYRAVARIEDLAQLTSSELPVTMKGALAGGREIQMEETTLLTNLHRWQYARANTAAVEGDVPAAFEQYREMQRLLEQQAKGDTNSESDVFHLFSARAVATALHELAVHHLEMVDAKHLGQLEAAKKEAEFNYQAYKRAEANVGQQATAAQATRPLMERVPTLRLILVWVLRPIVVLALLAGVLGGLGYLIGGLSPRPVGPVVYLPLFAVCLGLSVTLLGLAPGEVIAPEVQHWLFTLLALAIPLLIAVGAFWALWTGKQHQFSLSLLLIGMFVVSLLMGFVTLVGGDIDSLGTFPFRWSVSPQEITEAPIEWFRTPIEWIRDNLNSSQPGIWPLIQWWAYQGELVALGLWLFLLMMWQMIRDRRSWRTAPEVAPTWRDWLGPPLRTSAKAMVLVGLLLLIVYLAAVPALIEPLENQYQKMAAFGRNPQSHWDEIHQNLGQAKEELIREKELP